MAKPDESTFAEDVAEVYEKLGGAESLLLWASSTPERLDKFYQYFLAKRLPNEVTGADGAPILIQLKQV